MSELSEWALMKERGMSTFAEVPLEWGEENQRSECHPWSTIPDYHFFRTVCGIQPTSAGHQTLDIAPSFGDLKRISALYPHHLGNLIMNLNRDGSRVSGEITIPNGMDATFVWGNTKLRLKPGKQSVRMTK